MLRAAQMHYRRRTIVTATITLVVVLLGLAALPFWHKAADHFHYALPGRVPHRVEYKGRDYWREGEPCMSNDQLAHRFGASGSNDLELRRVGTLFGWLTRPRDIYTYNDVTGIPVNVFVKGGWGDCRFPYTLQGSP